MSNTDIKFIVELMPYKIKVESYLQVPYLYYSKSDDTGNASNISIFVIFGMRKHMMASFISVMSIVERGIPPDESESLRLLNSIELLTFLHCEYIKIKNSLQLSDYIPLYLLKVHNTEQPTVEEILTQMRKDMTLPLCVELAHDELLNYQPTRNTIQTITTKHDNESFNFFRSSYVSKNATGLLVINSRTVFKNTNLLNVNPTNDITCDCNFIERYSKPTVDSVYTQLEEVANGILEQNYYKFQIPFDLYTMKSQYTNDDSICCELYFPFIYGSLRFFTYSQIPNLIVCSFSKGKYILIRSLNESIRFKCLYTKQELSDSNKLNPEYNTRDFMLNLVKNGSDNLDITSAYDIIANILHLNTNIIYGNTYIIAFDKFSNICASHYKLNPQSKILHHTKFTTVGKDTFENTVLLEKVNLLFMYRYYGRNRKLLVFPNSNINTCLYDAVLKSFDADIKAEQLILYIRNNINLYLNRFSEEEIDNSFSVDFGEIKLGQQGGDLTLRVLASIFNIYILVRSERKDYSGKPESVWAESLTNKTMMVLHSPNFTLKSEANEIKSNLKNIKTFESRLVVLRRYQFGNNYRIGHYQPIINEKKPNKIPIDEQLVKSIKEQKNVNSQNLMFRDTEPGQ